MRIDVNATGKEKIKSALTIASIAGTTTGRTLIIDLSKIRTEVSDRDIVVYCN